MKGSRSNRRSKRIPATHRLFLTVPLPGEKKAIKEVVTTVEISLHGARIRGQSQLEEGWKGELAELRSLRKTAFRVAWQAPAPGAKGYFETGLEFLDSIQFWDGTFAPDTDEAPAAETAPAPPANITAAQIAVDASISPEKFLQELSKLPAFETQDKARLLETVWCGLVEHLEERKIFTRAELVASLRKLGQL